MPRQLVAQKPVAPAESNLARLERLTNASRAELDGDSANQIAALKQKLAHFETAVDTISQGICLFDSQKRLLLSNRRYAEIYLLSPEEMRPGASLREITERRYAVGSCPNVSMEEYLSRRYAVHESTELRVSEVLLRDGRTILVAHQSMPGGGWVSTHDDITQRRKESISLQTLIDGVPGYLWVKDTASRFAIANKAVAVDFGKPNTQEMLGLSDFDIHEPATAQRFFDQEQQLLAAGEALIDQDELVVNTAGGPKWMKTTKIPLRNMDGDVFGLVGIAHDITTAKKDKQLRDSQSQVLEMIALGAPIKNVLTKLMHLVESQVVGVRSTILLMEADGEHLVTGAAPSMPEEFSRSLDGLRVGPDNGSCGSAAYWKKTVVVCDIGCDPLWRDYQDFATLHDLRSCWSVPVLSHQSDILGTLALYSPHVREPSADEMQLIGLVSRIAGIAIERKLAEERILHMANHDTLTNLPNRTLLKDRLAQALAHAKRTQQRISVVFIDLDNFKTINDSLGHNAGDELLQTIATRMRGCVRASDTVVRFGGDEFVLILAGEGLNDAALVQWLQKLRAVISEPIRLEGHDFAITSSIGIACYPENGLDGDALLANADAAMYRAKDMGRDNFRFYTPDFNTSVHAKFRMQEELRHALARNQFTLQYQPQLDLRTGKIFAVEALLRWSHPELGIVSPAVFIPLAEETGLIVPIGEWVLATACQQNKAWQDAGLPSVNMCVNVSARQFKEKNWVSRVVATLKSSGLAAQYLELEITESLIMQDVAQAVTTMKELQDLGVQLAIDDFGTGYSSLSSLKNFPVARLKIDRSFVTDIPNNDHDKAVVSAVISLGQILNMRVIAEGVETDAQVDFLRQHNCDEMQGYHFSKPVTGSKMVELLGQSTR